MASRDTAISIQKAVTPHSAYIAARRISDRLTQRGTHRVNRLPYYLVKHRCNQKPLQTEAKEVLHVVLVT